MWKWGSAHSWWKSGAIVVWQKAPLQWLPVLLIWEMRASRLLQPLMVTRRIKEALLWMTLRTNEYEYIYKNRRRLPLSAPIGSDSHIGWARLMREGAAAPGDGGCSRDQTNNPHTRKHATHISQCPDSIIFKRCSGFLKQNNSRVWLQITWYQKIPARSVIELIPSPVWDVKVGISHLIWTVSD